jgi:hypothetical protein
MQISIHPTPQTTVQVEAFETSHPELAIHEISVHPASEAERGSEVGKVWAVSHIPSGELVISGLLTRDLATSTAEMLTATGFQFSPGQPRAYLLDSFQAAASLMTDVYFSISRQNERGHLTRA